MGKNILLITTDQQRWDTLGCYGCECIKTPNLDRLAAQGCLFTNCYVNNPVCTPSRASLLTGKSILGHGVHRVYSNFPQEEVPVSYRLQQQGYQTALLGKLHISSRSFELAQRHHNDGFDIYEYSIAPHSPEGEYNSYATWLKAQNPDFYAEFRRKGRTFGFVPEEYHFTHWAAERTIHFLENRDADKPFFCFMSVVDPHDPYNDYPKEFEKLVDKDKLMPPVCNSGEILSQPEPSRRAHFHGSAGSYERYSKEDFLAMRTGYYASIALIDKEVGRVLDYLHEAGLDETTTVIFTSDHGDMLGDHEQLIKGPFFYDASIRVPLIIRDPDLRYIPKVEDSIVQLHDLAATILGAAGWDQNDILQVMPESQDLIALQKSSWEGGFRNYGITAFRSTMIDETRQYFSPPIHATMIRIREYKMNVFHSVPGEEFQVEGQLFNMAEDSGELHNLWESPAHQTVKQELLLRLMDWLVANNVMYYADRGGEVIPPTSQISLNNLL